MAKLEKCYNEQGSLIWAKGPARDIYKDKEILEGTNGCLRIPGERRAYQIMIPRHGASTIIGRAPDVNPLTEKLPPYKKWQFVLVAACESGDRQFELSMEIDGDRLIEYSVIDV